MEQIGLKECYLRMGGNYDDVMSRLPREQLVQKFVLKFLEDPSYAQLEEAMAAKDYETAFRAAHTIKGTCQNLSFTKLQESSSLVTEALRMGDTERAGLLMERLSEDYALTIRVIREYKRSIEGLSI